MGCNGQIHNAPGEAEGRGQSLRRGAENFNNHPCVTAVACLAEAFLKEYRQFVRRPGSNNSTIHDTERMLDAAIKKWVAVRDDFEEERSQAKAEARLLEIEAAARRVRDLQKRFYRGDRNRLGEAKAAERRLDELLAGTEALDL